ncbi:WGR domain-containing protein [Roseofilum casamattae]|uniref:WGR domain-containing protein n=1 Tax=Roseofilum casamattae BLCC-M143 TaxID=3022442 RepID=A0ABT7BXV7_9CYAN|nr:WGR domain-containing protein [Roseofilum casamattae]MDJ1183991.1 WGR domain-containing protein [Roseofilum casamattae BLCC-M143]
MKRIKQTTLYFQDDRSDKIYEVDLVSTEDDEYLVNFRYGRRGTNLKEGTKTKTPVLRSRAEQIFDKLVQEKVKKGYRDIHAVAQTPTAETLGEMTREERILFYLQGNAPKNWPLSRIIWRAGELKITGAALYLTQMLGTGDALQDYSIVYALGRCGGKEALPVLRELEVNSSTPEFVQRMAREVMWTLGDKKERERLQQQARDRLPASLQDAIATNNPDNVRQALQTYLNDEENKPFPVIDLLYQTRIDITRPAVNDFARTAPLAPPHFKSVRHLFKMAEYRQDAELFSILARRFELNKPLYDDSHWYGFNLPNGQYLRRYEYERNPKTGRYEVIKDNLKEVQASDDTSLAYNKKTRDYLRKRVWRTLRKLGEEQDLAYIDLAVAILLEYSDEDAHPTRERYDYRYDSNRKRIQFISFWDKYSTYLTFNYILYTNSPRYSLKPKSPAWVCQKGSQLGEPPPEEREEAFPELWNQRPEALLKLLLESQCYPVHEFAVRALRQSPDFHFQIEVSQLVRLLSQPYDETTQFALNLARDRYTPQTPQMELVLALFNCPLPLARTQAREWIENSGAVLLWYNEFIAQLVLSRYEDNQEFNRQLLPAGAIAEDAAKVIIGRAIAELMNFSQEDGINGISETLLHVFPTTLKTLDLQVILDLLNHNLAPVQNFGAKLLLNHQTPATELPYTLIESLITSVQASIRSIGVEIFGQLGDRQLREDYRDVIIAMAINAVPDLRQSIKPVIARLVKGHPQFSIQLATEFIEFMLAPEPHEGVHKDLLTLLRDRLPGWKANISGDTLLRLLKSQIGSAQELGGLVLQGNPNHWAQEWSTQDIVKLASHEIFTIRQASWKMMSGIIDRIRNSNAEKLAAVRLLEAKWEDSQTFAREFFQQHFTDTDWTPEVMVLVCDSIREEVREFGRQLVNRTFTEACGADYLLKFSEHPSTDMQSFASGYLHNYAVDNPERLQDLTPYLITVLSQVNKGRVAKQNVFNFLEQEAMKSEAAAEVIARVLTRQSATMAIADKAQCLQLMVRLRQCYPNIILPIQIKPVTEVRR